MVNSIVRSYGLGIFLILLSCFPNLSCEKSLNYSNPSEPKYIGKFSDDYSEGKTLNVVTLNTNHARKIGQIIDLFERYEKLNGANLIFIQEADEKSVHFLAEKLNYNYAYIPSAVHPSTGKNFGNAILSKWDIVETNKMILPYKGRFNNLQRSVVKSYIDFKGSTITAYNVHFSTMMQLSPAERFEQAKLIFEDASLSNNPVIIAGDFNDRDLPELAKSYGFQWPTEKIGNTTYIFSWDHIITGNFSLHEPDSAGVIKDNNGSSDHYPVWAILTINGIPNFNKINNNNSNNLQSNEAFDLTFKNPPGSLGQPIIYKPYFGMSMLLDKREEETKIGGAGFFGIYRDLINPVTGIFGISAEAYIGGSSTSEAVGLRLLASSPVLHLHTGLDYEITENDKDLIISITPPLRRGGLFSAGDFLRIDWLPTRSHTFLFGVQFPLFQRAGKTRPIDKKVTLPQFKYNHFEIDSINKTNLNKILSTIREAGKLMVDYNTFFEIPSGTYKQSTRLSNELLDTSVKFIEQKSYIYPKGKSFSSVVSVYHEHIDRLFTVFTNINEEDREKLLIEVRKRLLEDIIIPYDRTIGQIKRRDSVLGMGNIAEQNLSKWIEKNLNIEDTNTEKILYLFAKLVSVIEDCRQYSLDNWNGDSRQVWLMYQYALRPHEHDTQKELDNIIEKSLDIKITDGNAVYVMTSADFMKHLARTIEATEDYHVLWVHDYRGIDSFGNPDEIGFDLTVNSYLDILVKKVNEYDKTGKIPVFIIIIDQFFYEIQKGRIWLSLLEDPLNYNVDLPDGYEYMENKIIERQTELREAVDNSKMLSAEEKKFGGSYIKDKVKVHINVTQPPDFSFLSPGIVKWVPILPDNIMIDHRKLAFYDITEQDPYKGEAIFTGTGIGEHYVTPTWEDRGLLTSGPALTGLKKMTRDVLIDNSLNPLDIPEVLNEGYKSSFNAGSKDLGEHRYSDARGFLVQNDIGYGKKYSTFVHSILYSLSPPGTTMILPDSLWLGEYWAGLVIGAAARGCNVYVISPSDNNAPSPGSVQMWRAKVIISRLLAISNRAKDVIEMDGGRLRIGIYNRESDVGNVEQVLRELLESYRKYDFLGVEFPFPDNTFEVMEKIADELEAEGYQPVISAEDKKDRLVNIHRKTRFFGSKELLSALAKVPASENAVRRTYDIFIRESMDENPGNIFELEGMEVVYPFILDYENFMEDDKFSNSLLFYSVGSMNHDPRGMMLDGEVSYLISGPWALWGYIDSLFLLGQVEWIVSQEELEKYMQGKNERMRSLGHWIRNIL